MKLFPQLRGRDEEDTMSVIVAGLASGEHLGGSQDMFGPELQNQKSDQSQEGI